jgi:putative oxidoreductase
MEESMTPVTDGAALLGRLLLSVIFVLGGAGKLADFSATVALMGNEGLPLPIAAAIVAIAVEGVGGALMVVGWHARETAAVLAAWCIATALVAHRDFAVEDQMINFLKNVAMAGGFLQVVAFGAGGWSLDARRAAILRGA